MKPYRALSASGVELGRLLARSDEEALKTAHECWPGRVAGVVPVEAEQVDPLS